MNYIFDDEKKLVKITDLENFICEDVFDCGQCFRWNRQEDGSYTGVAFGRVLNARFLEAETGAGDSQPAAAGTLELSGTTGAEFELIWKKYFDLERDYGAIGRQLSEGDPVMEKACRAGSGIRLLQQDPWETIISFIISQNSNIPRIKKSIESLCTKFGRALPGGYYSFPEPEQLAGIPVEDLAECRLGYRDTYVINAAEAVVQGNLNLEGLLSSSWEEASKALLSVKGIGPKVANCILLFGLKKYESFPIDVWMKRVMNELYGFELKDVKGMASYAREHFGSLSGFAQQYLFYYMRSKS